MSRIHFLIAPVALAACVLVATLAGCSEAEAETPPLPNEIRYQIDDPFGDVLAFCDGTTRVYVAQDDSYASSAIAVDGSSPECGA